MGIICEMSENDTDYGSFMRLEMDETIAPLQLYIEVDCRRSRKSNGLCTGHVKLILYLITTRYRVKFTLDKERGEPSKKFVKSVVESQ